MAAKLSSYSSAGPDDYSLVSQVAYYARVSNPKSQLNMQNNEQLIRYLIKHSHWSPFEMAHIVLEVKTTRDIARQLLRHRSFSFQEFSQRYAEVAEYGDTVRETRLQDYANRQNSIETDDTTLADWWMGKQEDVLQLTNTVYKEALKRGIAKEQARSILPEGLTPTTLYVSGTLRSWIHYIGLRTGPETQKEHRQLAMDCATAIMPVFPMIEEFVK